ncbi:MAG: hypothetical protein HY722_05250, partial [Planctomycetes bacterium]|nr:hypothetical protein [Planctomycetota bacterium]
LLGEAARKGEWLLGRLRGLAGRYPAQVAEVRGRGLMVGLELTRRPSPSPLLGLLGEQDLLGFLVAGHLLHVEGIRILPTLSRHSTIRIQPSVGIAMADLERLVASLGRVLEALRTGDVAYLAGYLVGRRATRAVPAPPDSPSPAPGPGPGPAQATPARRVGFLAHFLEAGDLGRFDPALADWGPEEAERFIRRTGSLLEPFVVDRSAFRSATGDSVELVVIGCAFTARQVMEGFRRGETASHVEQVERGVRLARGLGCTVVGLGGYTSIVTDAGRLLVEDQVALTTGNSLTVALAAEGLLQTARGRGLEPGRCRLGVVGATGNIGAVLAQCLMDEVGEVVLVGRPGSASRLEAAAEEVCLEAWRRLAQGHDRGLAARLAATGTVTALRAQAAAPGPVGRAIWEGLRAELGEATPVRCATDMGELRGCELVASASNAAEPVVRPEHLGEGTVVVCDVAVPRDVDPRVTVERPRATVIAGGIARAPLAQEVALRGMALAPGLVYGCMAETLLLGLTGITGHYSYGRLTTTQVRTMAELARIHGFRVEARHRKS